ncbi:MAG: Zn-dependent hydrolase [Planctomycetes bacterium]|nr:Zn-dependent hydrolase [Planctomycetota bacterium]
MRRIQDLAIDPARLYASLQALGKVGSYRDARSGLDGVCRLALTEADGAGRRHVVAAMRELGLDVRVDRIGNVYGRRAGTADVEPVLIGSHIDSVPTAGIFDGCLGVIGGLEVLRALDDAGVRTRRPLVVAFFTDEEGCRFGTDMLGSAVATGRIPLEVAYALTDSEGVVLEDALAAIGFRGEARERVDPPAAFLECHIEQGPLLRARDLDLGVVSGVQSISWHEVTIVGKSAHAGTTPMDLRHDAGVAAARINLGLRELIASGRFGQLRATMGAIRPTPNLVNIVPGVCVCTVDLRNPDDALMRAAEAEVLALYERVAATEGVELSWRQTARTDTVPFAEAVRERVAAAASAQALSHAPIVSGAGHDAQEFARLCPTGMIFVPGENDGISHNPRELSTVAQCANGVNTLLRVALDLAETP